MQRNVLKALREKNGITRSILAARIGVSFATVYRWELHEMPISFHSLDKLAEALNVKPSDIVPSLGQRGGTKEETARV